MSTYHIPVMLTEVLEYLNVQKDKWYVDCNLGGGGHTGAILEKGGKVLGIDMDKDAITEAEESQDSRLKTEDLILVQSNFVKVKEICEEKKIIPSGILFDLGMSTHQLEAAGRGFSFNASAPLDMRMDQTFGATAKDLVNGLHQGELEELFIKYGEEFQAKRIAMRIVDERRAKPIETTDELARIVTSVYKRNKGNRLHPATRIFQALRIAVNDELNSLKEALPASFDVLEKGGRLVVISFHSLEDRIVKNYFKELEEGGKAKILTDKPVTPSDEEVAQNPRSRSAKLRVVEKIS
ncbi:MAG: 16S rRNA (cytosine(1402)-N(4))-methyltransferase RsmH [bacterium]|nr:16S rRNA (cytosine(1402)-N(4))-methyltransferase RsmH [bacterium]